jgi:hypothetical protein
MNRLQKCLLYASLVAGLLCLAGFLVRGMVVTEFDAYMDTRSATVSFRMEGAAFEAYNQFPEQQIRTYRDNGVPNQYKERVPIEEIDFSVFNKYKTGKGSVGALAWAVRGAPHDERIITELPFTLRYYASPDSSTDPVYEIPKGTPIWDYGWLDWHAEPGYGIASFPTYTAGWRYVRPFVVRDGLIRWYGFADVDGNLNEDGLAIEKLEYYYVRTEDMIRLSEHLLRADFLGSRHFTGNFAERGYTVKGFAKYWIALRCDVLFYQSGMYRSPDLPYLNFDTKNTVLFSAAGVLLTLYIVLRVRRARQQRQKESHEKLSS